MGLVNSKSPLERRNTVLRRSQRKSMHGIKAKTSSIVKDIKKFKGTEEEDAFYATINSKIDNLRRELEIKEKNLQPELRNIHKEAAKAVEECADILKEKLQENQEKAGKKNNNVVERLDEEKMLEESQDKRRTVELNLVQIKSTETTPESRRLSIIKMGGVAVMPGSIMDAINRKSQSQQQVHVHFEDKVVKIRQEIEDVELEISRFIGKKYGKHYNAIKEKLFAYLDALKEIESTDEGVVEQVKLCDNYVKSCLSFLDEKAVAVGEEAEDDDDVFRASIESDNKSQVADNVSPRSIRTTYI